MKKINPELIAAISAVALLYSRRGSHLSNPQVWNEDGVYIVPQFPANGWTSLLEPVNGYLISISRMISNTALTVAPSEYPVISTLLVWSFTAGVAAFISSIGFDAQIG
ncbi:hypothetical protein SAMN04488040_0732 [Sulfitobacter marinus]|uniref:Uncharacterized protein n=1 Tax=Sulfitobacter marinus TaxID=394264 RepID=A0A1I6QHJ7_9RHOB|nr:hypothetical protein [Sulfitobacter marinus]SFS51926.1 hypothetical protein SAMN04488040_0732 [Sulfitobacter marinus]